MRRMLSLTPTLVCMAFAVQIGWAADQAASVDVFEAPGAETYFALGLEAPEGSISSPAKHVVVLTDTSASQVGEHREFAFDTLSNLLSIMDPDARVEVLAFDVEIATMTGGFVSPDEAATLALPRLEERFPAGSSDMHAVLERALDHLEKTSGSGGQIVYIGDGMSVAHLISLDEIRQLSSRARVQRVAIHSFAVGSKKDLQTVGVFALQTGGIVTVDQWDSNQSGREVARQLNAALEGGVVYPKEISVAGFEGELLPAQPVPLRADRRTYLIGRGRIAAGATVTARVSDAGETLEWTTSRPRNQAGNTFIGGLFLDAQPYEGLTLPVAGTEMLNLARQSYEDQIAMLEELGRQALLAKEFESASDVALQIRRIDPDNVRAQMIAAAAAEKRVVQLAQADQAPEVPLQVPDADANGEAEPAQPPPPTEAEAEGEATQPPPPTEANAEPEQPAPPREADGIPPSRMLDSRDDLDELLQERLGPYPGDLITDVEERQEIQAQRLSLEVANAISYAQEIMNTDPEAAESVLTGVRGGVRAATDLDPDTRTRLIRRLNDAILSVQARTEAIFARREREQQRRAEREAQFRIVDALEQEDQRMKQLVEQVRALLSQGFHGNPNAFEEAEATARVIVEMRPGNAVGTAALFVSEAAGQLDKVFRLRSLRADRFLETLYQVELSHVPFPDEPPVRYPPAEVWQALTEKRAKWRSVDLHKNDPNEQKIYDALEDRTETTFVDTPLTDAMAYLAEQHEIMIRIDETALADEGISPDEPVNLVLSGVTLRSALKLMLEPYGLTYVIEDEVMKITTQLVADEIFQTRVYPVADLVIPIQPLGGAMGGIGGGLGGGIGGGLGGGAGGGLGGGAGGGGLGGGGGFFMVPSEGVQPGPSTFDADAINRLKKKPVVLP